MSALGKPAEKDGPLLAGGHRANVEGWIYLRTRGSPRARGFQHGYLLANEVREAIANISFLIEQDTGVAFPWWAENALALFEEPLRTNWGGKLSDGSGARIMQELEGIVDGVNRNRATGDPELTLAELLAWNGYPEMICQWWPAVLQGAVKPAVPIPATAAPGPPDVRAHPWHHFHHSCSAFVATGEWTADGGIVAAQTTWQRFANGDAYNVIADINPPDGEGYRIVQQSVPGYVNSSTDFGVNGAGLVVAETSINGQGFDPNGLPEFFRSRRASQYANGIHAWRELFREGNNGGYTNSWLLADSSTGEISCYELTLKHDVLQPVVRSGCYTGCNIPLDARVRNLDCAQPSGYDDVRVSGARRVRWDALMERHKGRVDARVAKELLGDHYDVWARAEKPSSRTICGHLDNDDGAVGSVPGSNYPWGSLDGKVTTGTLAADTRLEARWGRACGAPLDVERFLRDYPQYRWLEGHMRDRPTREWTEFPADVAGPDGQLD
jgi:hypothetical protein